jgi:hypothetical protein
VAADGRVYVVSREGLTLVIEDGDHPSVIARNRLDDQFSASAALAGDEIFLRGERHLYSIASE